MTGRSLHDALLRVLTDGDLRRRVLSGDPGVAWILGAEEAAYLTRSDHKRLRGMARFMARHFYRERIVRLFRYGRALARTRGQDPLRVLESPAFRGLLDSVVLGSPAGADAVAHLVEAELGGDLAPWPFAGDLIRYEGTLFRVEAGPRRWHGPDGRRDGTPVRSPSARIVDLGWDFTPLMSAIRGGETEFPSPLRQPTCFLVCLSPGGRVTTLRCAEPLRHLLDALDGARAPHEAASAAGLGEAELGRVLDQLTELGAVEWRPAPQLGGRGTGAPREEGG